MYFDELPEVYRNAINDVIFDGQGDEDSDIAVQFREWQAVALLGCLITNLDNVDKQELETELCAFRAGWKAKEKIQEGRLL